MYFKTIISGKFFPLVKTDGHGIRIQVCRVITAHPTVTNFGTHFLYKLQIANTGADPRFPWWGANPCWRAGGCQPPMWALFGNNVSKNIRIGSGWGKGWWSLESFVCRSATEISIIVLKTTVLLHYWYFNLLNSNFPTGDQFIN